MPAINLLDKETINKIAAGEVVERPGAVVKELVENAIDANSSAITVEIKDGGLSLIRITDNGCGMEKEEIPKAFLRHSTSKISSAEDILTVGTLGFRGEALSSVAAIAQVELLSCTPRSISGSRYVIEGGVEKSLGDAGCPRGTTFLVRNLFYNAPVRKKFLKSNMTEGTYINGIIEKFAISHPGIAFSFIMNNQRKLVTSGNGNQRDVIYQVYGRDITANLLKIEWEDKENGLALRGYTGNPSIVRGNRNYMNYFVNGRYIKNNVINHAIEQAYAPYVMGRKYPFCVLELLIDAKRVDVNVHPAKMEVRFDESEIIHDFIYDAINSALKEKELIRNVNLNTAKEELKEKKERETEHKKEVVNRSFAEPFEEQYKKSINVKEKKEEAGGSIPLMRESHTYSEPSQMDFLDSPLLSPEARKRHKIIGQLFETYWIVEYEDKMFLIDQHAAHEKVIYEKKLKAYRERERFSQVITPLILTLGMQEQEAVLRHKDFLSQIGFEIEHFGGDEYVIRGVPADLSGLNEKEVFLEFIDGFLDEGNKFEPESILAKLASISCKAAVKGNRKLSLIEAQELIDSLMELENPYNCPHGRPTIISMSKYEIERKFKRII